MLFDVGVLEEEGFHIIMKKSFLFQNFLLKLAIRTSELSNNNLLVIIISEETLESQKCCFFCAGLLILYVKECITVFGNKP